MPLPNFPQMSLISNGNSVFWDISWESSLLLFQPNQADLILITSEITGASQSPETLASMTRVADRPVMAGS
jgi:hypothetical protein